MQGPFFLSHTCKLNKQKQGDVVLKHAANICPSRRYDFFPVCLLLTNYETFYNLIIVLSVQPPFEPVVQFVQLKVRFQEV